MSFLEKKTPTTFENYHIVSSVWKDFNFQYTGRREMSISYAILVVKHGHDREFVEKKCNQNPYTNYANKTLDNVIT